MNSHHSNKQMFPLICFVLFAFLSLVSKGIFVEISLVDSSTALKIICRPPSDNLDLNNKFEVLWHGTQFGENDLQKLSEEFHTDILMSNMSINSSKKHVCYLVAPKRFLRSLTILKKRVLRDDALASVPMENGICPPGHRIDQDRCFPCFPGSYTSGQDTECFLCPKDFYMNKIAADACWPCPDGKMTLAQGADSEDNCIYLDGTEHAIIKQSPPWIALYAVIAMILLCVWIAIIIFFIRYWKHRKEDDEKKEEISRPRKDSKIVIKRLSDNNVYETIPSGTDIEEPIYAEIDDYDDTYEIPRKPSDEPVYLDLEAPPLPPRRKDTKKTASISRATREKISEDQYEIPIGRNSFAQNKRSSHAQSEIPIKKRSDNQYEVPIQRHSDHTYTELAGDSEDHIYSEVKSEDEIVPDARKMPRTASLGVDEIRKHSSGARKYSLGK